ncbi:MAG: hypothetical protein IT334_02085 [Thermomicrobiales bacterium]|nr:hypothetical protein [Thermomicrobiales bacterium]
MTDRPSADEIEQWQERNRYAREVIAGKDVQLSHRVSNVVPSSQPRSLPSLRSAPSLGSPARAGYLLAIVAIILASVALYALLDFESASVALFILSLVLMAGWFVFSKDPSSVK